METPTDTATDTRFHLTEIARCVDNPGMLPQLPYLAHRGDSGKVRAYGTPGGVESLEMRHTPYLTSFLACLSAIVLVRMWDAFQWKAVVAAAICLAALNALTLVRYWHQGRRGLGQWPEPHGRFYAEWLKLPEGAGDYYDWLANRMGNREPWLTWARLDKQVGEKASRQK